MSVIVTKVEKTNTDYIWLNPKCSYNGQSAAKFQYIFLYVSSIDNTKLLYIIYMLKKVQRLFPLREVECKRLAFEVVRTLTGNAEGDDIVYALMKIRGCYRQRLKGSAL